MSNPSRDMSPQQGVLAVLAAWLVISALTVSLGWHAIASSTFHDPDDTLRLVQVRDWLAGQSWFDVTQYRLHPPQGTPMHWSRLVDLPIGLAIIAGRLVSPALAERLACVAVPLLANLVLMLCCYSLALAVSGRRFTALTAVILMSFTVSVLTFQFMPMRIDHHAWQIVFLVIATLLLVRPPAGVAAAAGAGLAAAMAVVISIECLPMAVALAGILALSCLRVADRADQLIAYLVALALGCAALHLATLGWTRAQVIWCDALSPAYLAPLGCAALLLLAARPLLLRSHAWRVVILFGLAPAAAALAFFVVGPDCLAGPFVKLDPLLRDKWYSREFEGLPARRLSIATLLASLIPVGLGMAGCLLALRHDAPQRRPSWLGLLLALVAATLVALMLYRAFGLALALAAPGNAWLLLWAFDKAMRRRTVIGGLSLAASCLLLLPWIGLAPLMVPALGRTPGNHLLHGAACMTPENIEALNSLPPSVLFTPMDLGAEVLARSRHGVVATSHHRNPEGIRAVLAGFTATPQQAEAVIAATGARYLVSCDAMGEMREYARDYPQSLAAALAAQQVPTWLTPVLDTPNHLRVYAIKPGSLFQP